MINYFARHPTIANLLMIAFLAIGAVSAPSLQRATFPRIEANTVQVTVAYPGASPETVEEAICQRIEDAIDTVDDVAEIECESREGQATATIEMAEGQDLDRFSGDVKTEIDAITDFPDNAEVPIIKQIGRTDFVASVAITGPKSRPDLKAYAEQIKDRMKVFGGIPKIEVKGFSDEQIRIEIPDATLRQYGLSFSDIASTIRRQNVDLPAGNITTKDGDILLRISDQRKAIDPLKDLIVFTSTDGGQIKLGDIARIDDRFEDNEVQIVFNGQPAALLDIIKSESDDTITVTERVKAFLDLERQRAPTGITFAVVSDGSTIIQDRLSLLLSNGAQGLLLVGIATWMFFGFRYSFWIVMGLPVAFMGGIAAMAVLGYSINMLTMVGLLIVVGILMDDAIVISENIATKSESGLPPVQAAGAGALEVMPGVLSSFLTTFCIFGSLAFLKGDIGQLIRVIPVVMIAVLIASLVEAFLILPHHLGHALHGGTKTIGRVQTWTADFMEWMRTRVIGPFAETCVKARYLTMGLAVGALILAITAMTAGALKFSPFPTLDGDTLEVRVLLPQGTPLERTKGVIARINGALDKMDLELTPKQPGKQKLILNRTVRYNENASAYENGSHVATLSIDVLSSELRTLDNDAFFARWRQEVGIVPDVLAIKYTEPSLGPAGRAIDIRLKGRDLETMKAASVDLQTWLHRYVGVVDLIDDLRLGKPEVNIRIKAEGTTLGLHAEDIANQIRAAFFGTTVDEIQTATKSLEIDVRLAEVDRERLATLDNFVVTTPEGGQVPLSAVATLTRDRGFARINRIDAIRTISVQGEVDPRFANANEVISDMRERFLPQLQNQYPDVTFDIAGQDKEASTTQASMMIGFMIGLVGVFLVLSFQFRSYMEPLVVMILIPFAFIGAVIGHITLGIEFTMPSMLGFAALAGIVVNDSILLVNQIKEHHEPGSTIAEIAPKAVQARFRAIFLTSITTVLGLLPLLLETSLQAQVLIPLVTSLAFGLMASTILVLFVVPTFYAILDDFGLTTLARERKALAMGKTYDSSTQPAE